MAELMNIGFGNLVHTDKIVAIITPDSAPAKRLVQHAKQTEHIVDATQGRKTRSILVMEQQLIILSALGTDTLSGRFHDLLGDSEEKE